MWRLIVADDTGTDPEPTGAERYLADRLRDPKYRAAYAAFRSQFPLPDTADDTGTDWAALADKLLLWSDAANVFEDTDDDRDDLRAAAVGLRRLAQLDTAESVGVDYCTLHHGIRNEDEHSCDFRGDDQESGDDGEPRECVLVELIPRPSLAAAVAEGAEDRAKFPGLHDRPDTGKECHYLAVTMPHGGLFCNKCGWAEGAEDRGQTDG